MSHAGTWPPRRAPTLALRSTPEDVWIGLDPAAAESDRSAILILDTRRAARAAEAAEHTIAAEARRSALLAAAGLVVGGAGTWAYDLVTAGPGLRVMVGL